VRWRGPERRTFSPDSKGKEGGRERQEDEERHRKAKKGRRTDTERKEKKREREEKGRETSGLRSNLKVPPLC
jgi:hypothetical protein